MSVLSLGRSVRRWLVVAAFVACGFAPHAHAQEADSRRQVVVLNSTRLDDQFSVTWSRELPKLLGDGLPEGVDFYAEYFDFVRYARPEYENAYLDLLRLKYGGGRADLVIVLGAIAINFMSRHRNDLFPDTPTVFYSTRSASPLTNATGLFNPLRFGRSIDLALALQPDLKRVYVVTGAGMDDRLYERQARAEFRPFESRVEFIYLSGLVMRELEHQLSALPPHSAVYYVVVREDGAGERFQVMDSLSRVASAANAPTYSWADAAVETGIVGGNRRDQVAQTKAIATLALRVLGGELVDDIPVSSLDTDVAQVDWRQLQRWGIDESRVPDGVRVLFRQPSVWDQYKRYIAGAVILMMAQTGLILGLLVQRTKRRRVELQLRGSQSQLRVSYDRIRHLSRQLLIEQEAERARISRELHDDINQQLAVLSIELDRIRPEQLPPHCVKRLSAAMETTDSISKSLRNLSHRLHPPRLTPAGLVAALDNLCRDLSPPHMTLTFSHRDMPAEIDDSTTLCLFRVAQEGLVNAVKHSDAGHVWIELAGEPETVTLTVSDDGKGFVINGVPSAGLGLISMRERVEAVGGVLEVQPAPAS
ncbi:MAG TPA: sensor histidine kinase, partial [Vicinamibacterales bacterium]|nr:sensor histidine kinase [Vicinamibacterales bacterium]